MHEQPPRERARGHLAHVDRDVYPIALACVGTFSVVITFTVLALGLRWETPILDLPLGAFLLGGAGGALTIAGSPSWARRLGSRYRRRVAGFTFYRLCSAVLMGGIGYFMLTGLQRQWGLVTPLWFLYALTFGFGILESFTNEVALRALGFLAPREIDPRLL